MRAHSSNLCDAAADSSSDTSSDEEQPDADASTNAVVANVATPAGDMNDSEVPVCFVAQRDAHYYRACAMRPPAFL